jgi:F-type H+-transporting ATPase subunit epsilon
MDINVRILTLEKTVWDRSVEELILPSSTGSIGILPNHAPLLTSLGIGILKLKVEGEWSSVVLMEGFAEVEKNVVTVLSVKAEKGVDINWDSAKIELEKSIEFAKEVNENILATNSEKFEASIRLRKAKKRLEAATNSL